MAGHCKDSLSHPQPGHLTAIDLEAEVNACNLKSGRKSRHTTTINNQRPGNIYQVDICVKSRGKGVILDGDPNITEYKHTIPVLRSGKKYPNKFDVTVNPNKPMPNDEIITAIVLYDSTQVSGNNYGQPEQASLTFTIDIS